MKKTNNWKLIGVLIGLVVIFVAIRIFRSPQLESNLPGNLTDIDSAKVTSMIIATPQEKGRDVVLSRANKVWELKSSDGRTGRLEQGAGVTALRSLMLLKPQRMVSKKKEKWNEFSVGDSTGTRVRVMAGESVEADLWIGRFGFTQGEGGTFGGAYTYVRKQGDNAVYAVEGFLEGQFKRAFNDWRDKSFLRLKRDSLTRITFRYPADSSFMLERSNGRWMMGTDKADSAAIATYLSGLEFKSLSNFAMIPPAGEPPVVISFEKQSKLVARIEAWPANGGWTLKGSQQPDTYFSSDATGVKELLKGAKALRPVPAKK